jgi:hypothetical protein
MNDWNEERLPAELREVADRMREQRAEVSPVQLDQIKLRARTQARSSGGLRWRKPVRSRAVSLILASLLVGGTAAGGIAASQNGNNGSAAQSQYRPGLGCGDKNHIHTGPPGNPDKTCNH